MSPDHDEDDLATPENLAFAEFVAQHEEEWLRLLRRLGLKQTEAEVLLHRVLRVLAANPTLNPARPGAAAFVRRRLDWRARDFEKSRQSHTQTGLGGSDEKDPAAIKEDRREPRPLFATMHTEARRRIWAAVCRLPEPWGFAIICQYWLDMTLQQIAALRGVPWTTVNSWLARARDRLRKELDPNLFPEDDDE
jgi:RNA polymerase sigma factor (sigma-70 family)